VGLLTDLLTLALDGLSEDVADTCRMLAEDVGVDAQSDGGIGVAQAGGDFMETLAEPALLHYALVVFGHSYWLGEALLKKTVGSNPTLE